MHACPIYFFFLFFQHVRRSSAYLNFLLLFFYLAIMYNASSPIRQDCFSFVSFMFCRFLISINFLFLLLISVVCYPSFRSQTILRAINEYTFRCNTYEVVNSLKR